MYVGRSNAKLEMSEIAHTNEHIPFHSVYRQWANLVQLSFDHLFPAFRYTTLWGVVGMHVYIQYVCVQR